MALLATDSMWVLTTCFDWGPVALQHLLGVAGMGLVVIFHRTGRIKPAMGAAFCFGLGLWDKALFAWLLGGLAVGAIAVFSREIWFHMRQPGAWKVAPAAVLAFGLGCSPLLVYNAANQWPTLHATSGFSTQDLYPKLFVLLGTWEGIALFGYIPHAEDNEHAKAPRTLVENVSFGLRHLSGEHRRNGLDWAVLSVALLLPILLWRPPSRRAVLFCLIAITVAWLQMGITKGAGGAAHHVVLLYPLPHILIAVVFAEMSLRWGAAGKWLFGLGTLCLAGMNLLVTNQYLYDFVRYGSAGSWSDAIYPLASGLKSARATEIAIIDWGITNPLEVLDRGRLPLFWAAEPFLPGAPGQIPSRPDRGYWTTQGFSGWRIQMAMNSSKG